MTDRPKLPDLPTFCAGPFTCTRDSTIIWGTDAFGGRCEVAQIRVSGYLTGQWQALALSSAEAIEAQRKTLQFIVDAINEKMERDYGQS